MSTINPIPPSQPHIGYGLVSELISSDADLNIFRRFTALNARNILYLQAELAELEARLHEFDEELDDRAKGNDVWALKKAGGEYLETGRRRGSVQRATGHEVIGNSGRMVFFSEDRIRSFVRFLAVVLSSVLPILSIVVLYFIPDQTTRLGAIVAFSALCSATLAALSNAKNVEIIAATAAYAAVQVVFVSGTSPTPGG